MDITITTPLFVGGGLWTTSFEWSQGNTVLTCVPTAPFPENTVIQWAFGTAKGADGLPLGGIPAGNFRTGESPGPGGGSGTNRFTIFTVGEVFSYSQISASVITNSDSKPYRFDGGVTLASNIVANSISLTLPTGVTLPLAPNPFKPESFSPSIVAPTNLASFMAAYPAGVYRFNVDAPLLPSSVTVNLSPFSTQPEPPRVSNFNEAQAINPTQPFILRWDPIPGATPADHIFVSAGYFQTPGPLEPGALNGTATSVEIPAGSFLPNLTNFGGIVIVRYTTVTNGNYVTSQYRSSNTIFPVNVGGGPVNPPVPVIVLTNSFMGTNGFTLTLNAMPGQPVQIDYTPRLGVEEWRTLIITNSPGTSFRIIDPQALTNSARFYRVRTGP